MCFKQNLRFKYTCSWYDYKNEWARNIKKHISCKCKCKFHGRKCNLNQKWNNDKCWCECKKHHICETDYIWNPATCSWKNSKYSASIIDDSVITCDEIIELFSYSGVKQK